MNKYPLMRASGPVESKIMLIGEAPGVEEMLQGQPFVGTSGKELTRMLASAGINVEHCYRTNVFYARPTDNKIENFCDKGTDFAIEGFPALFPGKYVNAVHAPEIERLYDEILRVRPNVICALGNTPSWALFRETPKISNLRGRIKVAEIRGVQFKVLPTYHPAFILRNWSERVITITDFQKLKREAAFPDLRLPSRKVLVDPTFREACEFFKEHVLTAKRIVLDVETAQKQITVCGVAVSPYLAAVIPFVDWRKDDKSYWSHEEECYMVQLFRHVLADWNIVKILQNGMYDLAYFVDNWQAKPQNFQEDPMLMQHAMWPELRKGLADLASIHTDEAAWKMMRLKNRDDIKRDE